MLAFYPVPVRSVLQDGEWMLIHPNGMIERTKPNSTVRPSEHWRVTGAVLLSRNGGVSRHYSLAEVLTAPRAIPWVWGNGKQHAHITDFDHGAPRMWGSPAHTVC